MEDIYPVLTPMAMDSARPFPLIANKALNIGLLIRKKEAKKEDELEFATVQVPSVLPRIYELPEQGDDVRRVISFSKRSSAEILAVCFWAMRSSVQVRTV